ncbi:MAG: energy-coupling factor transporter transmembrane protein EcfT [Akkermansiaceae bacterium]|nr:energy-coupling factor transporter transmembrane protein EcfT [Akkermansiaceae bacterium]
MSLAARAWYSLLSLESLSHGDTPVHALHPCAKTLVVLAFLVAMTGLPLEDLPDLLFFALYPACMAVWSRVGLLSIVRRSLVALPFALFVGLFNPWFDEVPGEIAGCGLGVSRGWLTFFGIVARALLAAQAVLLLVASTGFHSLCRSWRRLGVPQILADQLTMMYRALFLLVKEAVQLERCHEARGFGRPLGAAVWASLMSLLMRRTFRRAGNVRAAMLCRGWSGSFPGCPAGVWTRRDTLFLALWVAVFLLVFLLRPGAAWLVLFINW